MTNSFDSAATASGNFFENLGRGLLSAIGSFLIAEGTAAVLSGKTKIASGIFAGLGLNQVQAGYAAIAGGVALKAGAASIGRGSANRRGAGGGGSASSAANTSAATSAVATRRIQGSEQTIRVVGEIDGQVIRLNQQRAEDSYNGLS